MQKSSRQKHRERRQARLKRRIRTNSGAISMSEVEASSMAEPESTKKKKKTLNQLNLWELWQSTAVFKPVRLNRSSHGSLSFSYMPIFKVKRTVLMNGFRLSRLDRMVWSGFQNLDKNYSFLSQNFSGFFFNILNSLKYSKIFVIQIQYSYHKSPIHPC